VEFVDHLRKIITLRYTELRCPFYYKYRCKYRVSSVDQICRDKQLTSFFVGY